MSKPIIGVMPQYDSENERVKIEAVYFKAIKAFGGVPFLFPLENDVDDLERLIQFSDGFLYTGGPDIHPKYFGEEIIPECGIIMPHRDKLELELFSVIYETKKPIFGICRGIQSMNIALGGSIYQDIGAMLNSNIRVAHSQKSHHSVETHSVLIEKGTLLYDILKKDKIEVNSFHHQSIKALGQGVRINAKGYDEVIEAIDIEQHPFFLGVQWHPEYLYETSKDAAKLFQAFINACI